MAKNSENKIYITGVSGTGKSTIIRELKKRNFSAFDIEEMDGFCRWRNKKTLLKRRYRSGASKEWLDRHEWVCDIGKLKELIKKEGLVLVGGVVSNQKEFLPFFNKIFLLQTEEEALMKRLVSRSGEGVFGKTKIERDIILSWYKGFEKELLDLGAIPVKTESSIESAADEILSRI